MPFSFLGLHTHSKHPTVHVESQVPSRAEIDRQIAKLEEDSAKDVKRQLEEQRVATKKVRVEEDIKDAVEGVEHAVETEAAAAFGVAEHELEAGITDVEAGVKDVREDVHALERRVDKMEAEVKEEVASLKRVVRNKEKAWAGVGTEGLVQKV